MTQAPEDAILASWAANAAPWIALLQGCGIASRQTTNPAIINAINRYQPDSVLDVGCGTGILALFAASAGAKKVWCVERTPMASVARERVQEAGLSHVVEVLQQDGPPLEPSRASLPK